MIKIIATNNSNANKTGKILFFIAVCPSFIQNQDNIIVSMVYENGQDDLLNVR